MVSDPLTHTTLILSRAALPRESAGLPLRSLAQAHAGVPTGAKQPGESIPHNKGSDIIKHLFTKLS